MSTTLLAPAARATSHPSPPSSRRARVRPYPIAEPAGLSAWRDARAQRAEVAPVSTAVAMEVLTCVRAGASMEQAQQLTGLDRTRILDVVAGVGSKLGQTNKTGPRARECWSFGRGVRAGIGPGVHTSQGLLWVVMGDGWAHTRKLPRDIGRSYAAAALADPQTWTAAVERWLRDTSASSEVTYQHLAHLYAVATGTFASLEGISTDAEVHDAYLRAFDLLVGSVRSAHQDLAVILDPSSSPATIHAAVRRSFWLLGRHARPLAALSRTAAQGDQAGARSLHLAVAALRAGVERSPRLFFPASLADLTLSQFRAICAVAGLPVPTDDEGARDGAGEHGLLAALRERRSQLAEALL